jgi:DNA-binding TFAR19-related protein (PDSD5 family)
MHNDELKRLHAENAQKALEESKVVKRELLMRVERIIKRLQASGEIRSDLTVEQIIRGNNGTH